MTKKDNAHVKTALKIFSKKLGTEAEALKKLNQEKAAKTVEGDMGQLDELMPRVLDDKGVEGFNEHQLDLGRTAVGMLVRNTKAASGTLLGIGRDDWASELKEAADYIEQEVAPLFGDQLVIEDGAKGEKKDESE